MGEICSCGERNETLKAKEESKQIRDNTVQVLNSHEDLKLFGNTLAEISKTCKDYRPTILVRKKNKKNEHSDVVVVMLNKEGRNFDHILVEIMYNSKGSVVVKIQDYDDNNEEFKNNEDRAETYEFTDFDVCNLTFEDFLVYLDKNNGKFEELLLGEKNMGKVIYSYFTSANTMSTMKFS